MMNTTQIEALKTAVRYLANSEHSHFVSEGEPDDHIYRTVMTLNHFLDGDENQADNGADNPTAGSPIGIVRDHDLTDPEITASLRINLFREVSQFSSLPRAILEFATTAQQSGNVALLEAALAAMRSYKHKLDDDIPF